MNVYRKRLLVKQHEYGFHFNLTMNIRKISDLKKLLLLYMLYYSDQQCLVSPTVIVREQVVGGWAGEKVNEVSEKLFVLLWQFPCDGQKEPSNKLIFRCNLEKSYLSV